MLPFSLPVRSSDGGKLSASNMLWLCWDLQLVALFTLLWWPSVRLYDLRPYRVNVNHKAYNTFLEPMSRTSTRDEPLSQSELLVITAPLLSSDNFLMDSAPALRQTPVGPRIERGRPASSFYISVIIPLLMLCLHSVSPQAPPAHSTTTTTTTTAHKCKPTNTLSLVKRTRTTWKMNEGASACKWPWDCKPYVDGESVPQREIKWDVWIAQVHIAEES